jgi:hypothetical protein
MRRRIVFFASMRFDDVFVHTFRRRVGRAAAANPLLGATVQRSCRCYWLHAGGAAAAAGAAADAALIRRA